MLGHDRLAALMAEQANTERDVEARELLAAVRRKMFARAREPLGLGRYRDLQRIGAGGMGIVYSAHDPSLDRRVALKVLRTTTPSGHDAMLREARILAQTSHPNLVQVLDVGQDGDEVFIAMELVPGGTLGKWLDHQHPTWLQIVEALGEAGRGLAAAHEQGVIHRDFKPSNVVVGDDGRVRVMDFGLAIQLPTQPSTRPEAKGVTSRGVSVTEQGGTLGYAAPEQVACDGRRLNAAVDQFALGVCLYEALGGRRPYAASSVAEFQAAVEAGPPPLRRGEVPRPVALVIARALALRPEHRFASMNALVEALALAARTPKRRRVLAMGVALGGAALAALAVTVGLLERTDDRCPASSEMAGLWEGSARERAASAFEASELPYAATSFDVVEAHLGAEIEVWVTEYEEACRAGPAGPADTRFDGQLACLDERRAALVALVELLGRAKGDTIERAVESVLDLPSATRCRDPDPRHRMPVLDTSQREALAELMRRVAVAGVLVSAGAYDEAEQALGEPLEGVDESAYAGHLAEYVEMRGRVAKLRGASESARTYLERAHHLAVVASDDRWTALIAADLAVVVGIDLGRPDEGRTWQRHAEAALERRADRSDGDEARVHTSLAALDRGRGDLAEAERRLRHARALLELGRQPMGHGMANVLTTLGAVLHDSGRPDEAFEVLEQALVLFEQSLGAEHPRLIAPLVNLGVMHQEGGDSEAAVLAYLRARELARRSLGPEHQQVAVIENNLGNVAVSQGEDERARGHFERALAIFEAQLGSDHPQTVLPLVNLGSLHGRAGRHEQERKYIEHALEVLRTIKGPDDPTVAQLLVNLGQGEQVQGHVERAREHYVEAREIFERRLGADHPNVAVVLFNLAVLDFGVGQVDRACEQFERALAIREASFGPRHPSVARTLVSYGVALTEAGQLEPARVHLRRAIELHLSNGERPWHVAKARLALADLQWQRGERAHARAMATEALLGCPPEPPASAGVRAEIVEWQRGH